MKLPALILSAIVALGATAATPVIGEADDMEWDEILNTPAVPQKANAPLSRHMEALAKSLRNQGMDARLVRKNEVILVTIPASTLFAPNSTDIIAGSQSVLGPLAKALANPESYRVLLAVYTDNTGDDQYADSLTEERAEAVHGILDDMASSTGKAPNLYYSSFGNERPLTANNSIENRAKNRRVEIYIIPEQRTIDAARAGKL